MSLSFRRVGANLAAEVTGIDLARPLDDEAREAIHDGLAEHQLLIFRDQVITSDDLMAFGECFGELSVHPFAPHVEGTPALIRFENNAETPPFGTDVWHSDETFRAAPPMATALCAKTVPEVGGDTDFMFVSMSAAYEGLSARTRDFIDGLQAIHDIKPFKQIFDDTPEDRKSLQRFEEIYPPTAHPVVRVHPATGRRVLYVNPQFTIRIGDMDERESASLLDTLFHQALVPEYQYRLHWRPHTLAMWDNRSVQHYAVHDYWPEIRIMDRVTIKGSRPVGVEAADPATVQRPKKLIDELTNFRRRRLPCCSGAHKPHLVEDDDPQGARRRAGLTRPTFHYIRQKTRARVAGRWLPAGLSPNREQQAGGENPARHEHDGRPRGNVPLQRGEQAGGDRDNSDRGRRHRHLLRCRNQAARGGGGDDHKRHDEQHAHDLHAHRNHRGKQEQEQKADPFHRHAFRRREILVDGHGEEVAPLPGKGCRDDGRGSEDQPEIADADREDVAEQIADQIDPQPFHERDDDEPGREHGMGQHPEQGIDGNEPLALQQNQTSREQEAYREDRHDRFDIEQETERDAEQHRMGKRGAEIRHAPPHHKTPDRPRGKRRPDPAAQRAQNEIFHHECRSGARDSPDAPGSIESGSPSASWR